MLSCLELSCYIWKDIQPGMDTHCVTEVSLLSLCEQMDTLYSQTARAQASAGLRRSAAEGVRKQIYGTFDENKCLSEQIANILLETFLQKSYNTLTWKTDAQTRWMHIPSSLLKQILSRLQSNFWNIENMFVHVRCHNRYSAYGSSFF